MSQDKYGFRQIPEGAEVYISGDWDMIQKSAYYWGKVLNCRFATEVVGGKVAVKRLTRRYRDRNRIDFEKLQPGDRFELLTQNPVADRSFLYYQSKRWGMDVSISREAEGKRQYLRVEVLSKERDWRRIPALN